MKTLSTTLIFLVGLINLLPSIGVLSAARLEALYGLEIVDANVIVLMRHRAVLFGIIGGLVIASAFYRAMRGLGLAIGLTSMLSFVLIAWLVGGHNAELGRVVSVDLVASVALVAAALIDRRTVAFEVES